MCPGDPNKANAIITIIIGKLIFMDAVNAI